MGSTYQQAGIPVVDPERFDAVQGAVHSSLSTVGIEPFLRSIARSGLRIRDFKAVLEAGLLGKPAIAQYAELGDADQGQIRELYLHSIERVSPELRKRFFKLYAYY